MAKSHHPPSHTAEHILNQTMDRLFGCGRCFSAHVERKKSKCDYRLDRLPDAGELAEVARMVNAVIAADLPVTEHFLTRAEAEGRFRLDRLPDDAGETLRIVCVGDYDACPCIGEHADATGGLGAFEIISADCADGVLRLRWRLRG